MIEAQAWAATDHARAVYGQVLASFGLGVILMKVAIH